MKRHQKAKQSGAGRPQASSTSQSKPANGDQQLGTQAVASPGPDQSNSNHPVQTPANANNGQLPPATDLHDFVNRYGESPAAYLTDHAGMSPEQAVQSVPNGMKSSGEMQDTYLLQQGQDPFH